MNVDAEGIRRCWEILRFRLDTWRAKYASNRKHALFPQSQNDRIRLILSMGPELYVVEELAEYNLIPPQHLQVVLCVVPMASTHQ
jgi:hypothetical protein